MTDVFRDTLGRNTFKRKYALNEDDTWQELCHRLVDDVCGTRGGTTAPIMSRDDREYLEHEVLGKMKFIPGGRYLYYAGRPAHFWNNCFVFIGQHDTREEWARICHDSMSALSCGGGVGHDYSVFRPAGRLLRRTGGTASGPIPLCKAVNEIGRQVMQGGSRRSAMYGSLAREHEDIWEWLRVKDWHNQPVAGTGLTVWDLKNLDFNYPAPLDMTNISTNYGDEWLALPDRDKDPVFLENVRQALRTAEPGFSFNFGPQARHTGRNAPVSADTRVLTPEGYVRVRDTLGERITVWTGYRWAETEFKRTAKNVETVTVSLSNGREVTCDPGHPFIVPTKKGRTRIAAEYLEPGTPICGELPAEGERSTDLYGYGFVFGDGHIRNSKGDLQVFTEAKRPCFDLACAQLQAQVSDTGSRAYFRAPFTRKPVMLCSGFVAGWFDADGCYSRGLLRISSTDDRAIEALQEWFDGVGIASSVYRDGKTGYGTERPMYSLLVWKSSHNRFRQLIPTLRVAPDPVEDVRLQRVLVTGVRPSGVTEDVYCCDVGVEEHSFMAAGILLSNCTEFISDDDSDVCNLGSVNFSRIGSLLELEDVTRVAAKFLICGSIRGELPHDAIRKVRDRNRRIGMGIMGLAEWQLMMGEEYGPSAEMENWLAVWARATEEGANEHCDRFFLNRPKAYRAVAPAGTIALLAGTTSGIEPPYAVAFKRRYLVDGKTWKYQFVVDSLAKELITSGVPLEHLERNTALALADQTERRLGLQALVQKYTDMGISSTINLPAWGTEHNNEDTVPRFAKLIAEYAPKLRGVTFYPDGARGGQPITAVPYAEAVGKEGVVYEENADAGCASGVCGI